MSAGRSIPNRESERNALFYKFKIVNGEDNPIGLLEDLTLRGLKVIGPDPVQQDQILDLKLILPPGISDKNQVIFSGECSWIRKEGDSYHIGFKILKIDPEIEKIFKVIIDLLASPDHILF